MVVASTSLALHVRGLAGLLLEAHAEELGLAPGLDLDLGHELALGLLGGEARDALELAALLLEGRAEPGLLRPPGSAPARRARARGSGSRVSRRSSWSSRRASCSSCWTTRRSTSWISFWRARVSWSSSARTLQGQSPWPRARRCGSWPRPRGPWLRLATLASASRAPDRPGAWRPRGCAGRASRRRRACARWRASCPEISDEEGEEGDERQNDQARLRVHRSLHSGA